MRPPEVERLLLLAKSLPTGDLPRLLGDLAEIVETARSRLLAPEPPEPADELLTVRELQARTKFSADYIYRHADTWPFTRRSGRSLRFSQNGLESFLRKSR